jgi:putative inorganic carbon (HCO3(-)) transporter
MADAVAAPSVATPSVVLPNLDRIIRGLLYVYIFSLPFKHLLFIERNGFIILIVLLVLWCVVNRRHFFIRTPIDLPLLAFVAWVGFTVPFATFPDYSFKEFAKLLQQGLIFYVVVYFFRDPVHRRRLVWMLIGELALVSAYGIWQFLTDVLPYARLGELAQIESFLPAEVWLTTYLVMLIPFSLSTALYENNRSGKVAAWAGTVLGAITELLTFSRAGLLALFLEVIGAVVIVRRRIALVFALAFIGFVVLGAGLFAKAYPHSDWDIGLVSERKFDTSNLVARLNIWKYGLGKIPEKPLTGFGYGKDNFYMVFGHETSKLHVLFQHEMPAGTHNIFIDLAVGVGPIGLALFLWLLGAVVAAAFRKFLHSAEPFGRATCLGLFLLLVGTVVRNSFDHMLVGSLAVLFWVLVALALPLNAHKSELFTRLI